MSLPVRSTKDIKLSHLSLLVYAEPKKGKSYLGATFPKPLIIATEMGLLTLRESDVHYILPKTWEDILSILRELEVGASEGVVKYSGNEYQSVVIDSLNELYQVCIDKVLTMGGQGKNKDESRELPSMPDYGLARDRMKRLIKTVVNLPVHKLFTCLEEMYQDDLTKKVLVEPMIPGKLSREVPAMVDFWFHGETKEEYQKDGSKKTTYWLLTESEGLYSAGGREGLKKRLARHEPNDFAVIYKKLTNPA